MLNKRNIIIAAVVLVALIFIGLAWIEYGKQQQRETVISTFSAASPTPSADPGAAPNEIQVHVKGAVASPGVYTQREGERVYNAIESAGGALEDADLDAINLSEYLKDAQEIYLPRRGETQPDEKVGSATSSGKININTATEAELITLPGIGAAYAQRIIDYRTQNGAFKKIEDLMKVSGIGAKKFEALQASIAVN